MSPQSPVLLIDAAPQRATALRGRLGALGFHTTDTSLDCALDERRHRRADVALLILDEHSAETRSEAITGALERLSGNHIATLVWGWPESSKPFGGPLVEWAPADSTLDEIIGRLCTLTHYAPLLRRFEREFDHLQRLGTQLNRYFSEIDQEMRLAGRLQRDFLPRRLPQVRPLQFAAVFRPATWVSGDMYDVFRIDESHTGLYVADAMGHGIAAGLMTMFLRQALVAKHVTELDYSIVNPAEAMTNLNAALVRQNLPNCQFVTAVYAVINSATLELRLSRGGHPHPLLIRADGRVEEIVCDGPLLGLNDVPASFVESRMTLRPGEKVLLYTDGVEEALFLPQDDPDAPREPSPQLREWVGLGAEKFIAAIEEHLDNQEGSLNPADDVTAIVLEVDR